MPSYCAGERAEGGSVVLLSNPPPLEQRDNRSAADSGYPTWRVNWGLNPTMATRSFVHEIARRTK